MFSITFNPGPSQISEATRGDLKEAIEKRIIEISHRSKDFDAISESAIKGLRQFLRIPDEYYVFYTTSATEAMDLTIRHCAAQKTFHCTNGNFSEYFAQIAKAAGKKTVIDAAEWGEQNKFSEMTVPKDCELITITANETSTGVMCSDTEIATVQKRYPEKLLVIDTTSNSGVVQYTIQNADIWLFSVQKCFGMPAGLGIWILSPRAYERATHYSGIFSVQNMQAKMQGKYETIQTPNVLNIYLLHKQMERWNAAGGLRKKEEETLGKAQKIADFFSQSEQQKKYQFFVRKPAHRSVSVITMEAAPEQIEKLHESCKKAGIILGKGYGKIKERTFRISNFPAISIGDVEALCRVL